MSTAAARAWHGVDARCRRLDDGAEGESLQALARAPLALDGGGVDVAWGRVGDATRTILAGVRRERLDVALPAGDTGSWGTTFEAAVTRIGEGAVRPALALGGGLDAAAILVAWKTTGRPMPVVLTLATGLDGYDEVEQAERVAAACGAPCERVDAPPAHWLEVLPSAVAAAGTPLYNLHPVGRWLVAAEARRRGCDALITGDGADAAFTGLPDLDYVPIVTAMGDVAGAGAGGNEVARYTRSPFLDDALLAATLSRGVDVDKTALRRWLAEAAPEAARAVLPKRPRLFPALDLHATLHAHRAEIDACARALGRQATFDDDRARVGWLTLALLLASLRSAG